MLPPQCDPDTGIILRIWASLFVSPCFTYFASALASLLAQTLHLSLVRLLFRTPLHPTAPLGQICMSLLATDIFDTLPQSCFARHINGDRREGVGRQWREVFCQLSIRASIVRRDCVGTPRLLAAAGVIELKGFAAAHIPSPPCT